MPNFPTSLDSLTNPTASDFLNSPSHSAQHANVNDICEALEAKVGINSSAVTTSHDYKLSEVTGVDKAVGKTASQDISGKRFTDAIGMQEISAPSSPSAGYRKLYYKTDGKLYSKNSSGVESQVGGAGDFLVTQVFS